MTTKLIQIPATPNPIQELLKTLEKFLKWYAPDAQYHIAGGAVRKAFLNEPLGGSDIDFFFPSHADYQKVLAVFNNVYTGTQHPNCRQFFFGHAINSPFDREQIKAAGVIGPDGYTESYTVPIQTIDSNWFPTMETLIEHFDFTICQMVYHKGHYYISEQGYSDHQQGILDFANVDYDVHRFKHQRLIKYVKNGYTPTLELYAKIFLTPDAIYPGDFNANDPNAEYEL